MIGWYVHAHGRGHLTRLLSIVPHLLTSVTVLSPLPRPVEWAGEWIELEPDLVEGPVDETAGGVLHWAPRHHPGMLSRGAAITAWAARAQPDLVVVDVSVEVALQVRLLGIPVVVMGMRGDRRDRAHQLAYDLADALLCPWPASLPEQAWPARWREKAWHVGGLSRLDGAAALASVPCTVAVLWGEGGAPVDERRLGAARSSTPDWTWDVVRETTAEGVAQALGRAQVVVTHAGQNALAEVAALRRPAVVLPQPRPYGEQQASADALRRGGIAVVRDAWPEDWPTVLAEALRLGGAGWARWCDGHGAQRAAALLDQRVGELCAQR